MLIREIFSCCLVVVIRSAKYLPRSREGDTMDPSKALTTAVLILKQKGVIVYPTETFFALGGIALFSEVVERIGNIKKRPSNKPFPIIIGDVSKLKMIVSEIPLGAEKIISKIWPAPLSLILRARKSLPSPLVAKDGTICVRCPSHPIARELSLKVNAPLIATSANISGQPPCSTLQEISPLVLKKVDFSISIGPSPLGHLPSTIVSFTPEGYIRIIRDGAYPVSDLKKQGFVVV